MHQTTIQLDTATRSQMEAIAARRGLPETRHATAVISAAVFNLDIMETARDVLSRDDFAAFVTALFRPATERTDEERDAIWREKTNRHIRWMREMEIVAKRLNVLDQQLAPFHSTLDLDEATLDKYAPIEEEANRLIEWREDLMILMDVENHGRSALMRKRDNKNL